MMSRISTICTREQAIEEISAQEIELKNTPVRGGVHTDICMLEVAQQLDFTQRALRLDEVGECCRGSK
jgi:hypothetical protein